MLFPWRSPALCSIMLVPQHVCSQGNTIQGDAFIDEKGVASEAWLFTSPSVTRPPYWDSNDLVIKTGEGHAGGGDGRSSNCWRLGRCMAPVAIQLLRQAGAGRAQVSARALQPAVLEASMPHRAPLCVCLPQLCPTRRPRGLH